MAHDEPQADTASAASSRPADVQGQRCRHCPHRKRDLQASTRHSLIVAALVVALGLVAGLLVAAGLIAAAHATDRATAESAAASAFTVTLAAPTTRQGVEVLAERTLEPGSY